MKPEPDPLDTMLDLAAAYIDMNDQDGSWHLLQQVIDHGNMAQRTRARELMDLLPRTYLPITASSALEKIDLPVPLPKSRTATPADIVAGVAAGLGVEPSAISEDYQEDLFA